MKTYLHFDHLEMPSQKTHTWAVRSVQTNQTLGAIRWFASERKYCFFALSGLVAILDDNRLIEIAEFIRKIMAEHCSDEDKAKYAKF